MQIAIFELEQWERESFEELTREHNVQFLDHPLNGDNAVDFAEAEVISTFIYSKLSSDVLRQLNDLKLIATRSTGFDHIDLDDCKKKGIVVSNVPTYGEYTVAEHVFGLLLVIAHRLREAMDRTRRGDFSLQGLRGFDLRGKTLGVIGTGAIGRCVIEIAQGFRINVLAFDIKPDYALEKELGFRYVSLDELLANADFVTLHVPANKQTHNLLSDVEFKKMKPGVVLVNTARGNIVDSRALVRALADGEVAAAGLDVLPEEPAIREEAELLRSVFRRKYDLEALLADHILLRLRNVIVTPHSAFNTREAVVRILTTTKENITAFIAGSPINVVDQ